MHASGERKGERRGRDLHEEREGEEEEKEGVVRQGEGGREAQREGQNSEKGGGGSRGRVSSVSVA